MKSRPSLTQRASRLLAEAPVGADSPTALAEEQSIDALRKALRQKKARTQARRRVSVAIAFAAIAASLALGLTRWSRETSTTAATASNASTSRAPSTAIAHSMKGSLVHITKVGSGALAEGGEVSTGDRVLALQDAGVELRLATRTRLRLEGGADVTLLGDAPTQIIGLGAGALHTDVEKLKPGERFIVRTADAEIEVRGTSFRVAMVAADASCGHGTTTRVTVDEGIVTVRAGGQEWLVPAPESWPKACNTKVAPPEPTATAIAVEPTASQPPKLIAAPTAITATSARPSAVSGLPAQNDLFEQAMTAKRAGQNDLALKTLDRLLAEFPAGPLGEHALTERMRILRSVDPTRAAAAATAYLARFPNGVARPEAEAILRAGAP